MVDFQKSEQERIKNEIIEHEIKIVSVLYDKSCAYTQLIIVAGYAGFFGIWSLIKEDISSKSAIWSALFLISSIAIFVFFEVGKMTYTSIVLWKRKSVLENIKKQTQREEILKIYNKYELEMGKLSIGFIKFWICTLIPTVLTALAALVILLYTFIKIIISS